MIVQAIITARGGSKGLPRKNVLPLAGKPLIAWTIEAALACPLIDQVILSSDDDEICAVAQAHGCAVPFRRPAELATERATSMDVVRHAVAAQAVPPDIIVLLQPTSPLRTAGDLAAAIRLVTEGRAPACVGVTECKKPPQWMYRLSGSGQLTPVLPEAERLSRRQDMEPCMVVNGAIYVARLPWLLAHGGFMSPETVAHVMAAEHSVDIDDHIDFKLAELLMQERVRASAS